MDSNQGAADCHPRGLSLGKGTYCEPLCEFTYLLYLIRSFNGKDATSGGDTSSNLVRVKGNFVYHIKMNLSPVSYDKGSFSTE